MMVEFPWLWVIAAAFVTKYGNSSSCYQNNSENGNNSSCYQFCLNLVDSSCAPVFVLYFEFSMFLTSSPTTTLHAVSFPVLMKNIIYES